MEEQNKQTLENQETNVQEAPAAPKTKNKKRITKKMIIILAAAFVLILAAVLFLAFDEVKCVFLNHDYEATHHEATCEWDGYTRYTCSKCGDFYSDYHSGALGHDWQPATCTEYEKCKICGEKKSAYLAKHDYSTTDGTCTVCGAGVKFIVPAPPKTISYYSTSICKIESIIIERIDSSIYEITFLVESIYHKNGNSYSDSARFGWKLYDEDGVVVDSGTGRTDGGIAVGEKSKEVLTFYTGYDSCLQDGKTYRLELLDIG